MNTISTIVAKAKHLTLFVLLIFVLACSSNSQKQKQIEAINQLEKILFNDEVVSQTKLAKRSDMEQLRTYYTQFLQDHPSDTISARFLYNWAMMEADYFKQFEESATLLERFQREFPKHDLAAKALFLQAFTYAEYVKDYSKAELAYKAFIQRYPEHELVPSIQFELQNLGKSPEELLNLNREASVPDEGTKNAASKK